MLGTWRHVRDKGFVVQIFKASPYSTRPTCLLLEYVVLSSGRTAHSVGSRASFLHDTAGRTGWKHYMERVQSPRINPLGAGVVTEGWFK